MYTVCINWKSDIIVFIIHEHNLYYFRMMFSYINTMSLSANKGLTSFTQMLNEHWKKKCYLNKFRCLQSSWNIKTNVNFDISFLVCQFDYWHLGKRKGLKKHHCQVFCHNTQSFIMRQKFKFSSSEYHPHRYHNGPKKWCWQFW